jgi:hypothetical protein
MEVIFEVRDGEQGGFWARALGYDIYVEADTWENLSGSVIEAVLQSFASEAEPPKMVLLHYVKDELIQIEAE